MQASFRPKRSAREPTKVADMAPQTKPVAKRAAIVGSGRLWVFL